MQKPIKFTIKATYRVATGHRPHITGTGVQQDKRTKRCRTRSQQRAGWKKEYNV